MAKLEICLDYIWFFLKCPHVTVHPSSRMTDVENYTRYTIRLKKKKKKIAKQCVYYSFPLVYLNIDKLWSDGV